MSPARKTKPSASRAARTSWPSGPNRKKLSPTPKRCSRKAPVPRLKPRARTPRRNPLRLSFHEIPAVAVEVFEDHHRAIGLVSWFFDEPDAARAECRVVAREIVGVQEKEDAAAGLVTDAAELLLCRSPGEQERCLSTRRRHAHEALFLAEFRVLDEPEAQLVAVPRHRFVIIPDHKGDVRNMHRTRSRTA